MASEVRAHLPCYRVACSTADGTRCLPAAISRPPTYTRLIGPARTRSTLHNYKIAHALRGPLDYYVPVVLDCHPIFTTIIILAGWLVKTAVASLVSEWVRTGLGAGGDDKAVGEMWLAYSIP